MFYQPHKMLHKTLFLVFLSYNFKCGQSNSNLWPKGVVHYAINPKDYDLHSQDEIESTLNLIQKEICLKFFNTPFNYTDGDSNYKVLYITNPHKRKGCTPAIYNFNSSVVDMVIGYRCLNQREIAAAVVDMLRNSIDPYAAPVSYIEANWNNVKSVGPGVLSSADRNYINENYRTECEALDQPSPPVGRSAVEPGEELQWYKDRLWPLGVVMYTVAKKLRGSQAHTLLKHAMTAIELSSCVVFQFQDGEESELEPTSMLEFGGEGEGEPALGRAVGVQRLNLSAFVHGAPGHRAHALNNLMRVLGVPMVSNRHDRDSYVAVNWGNVAPGKGHYLEKSPEGAWLRSIPYDWASVTHAPANYMCADCRLGQRTVEPLQEHLWQRTLAMGRGRSPSEGDRDTLRLLYGEECRLRVGDSAAAA